jgi:hypothetical protein
LTWSIEPSPASVVAMDGGTSTSSILRTEDDFAISRSLITPDSGTCVKHVKNNPYQNGSNKRGILKVIIIIIIVIIIIIMIVIIIRRRRRRRRRTKLDKVEPLKVVEN